MGEDYPPAECFIVVATLTLTRRPVRFALANALDLWRVQGIDLAASRRGQNRHRTGYHQLAPCRGDVLSA